MQMIDWVPAGGYAAGAARPESCAVIYLIYVYMSARGVRSSMSPSYIT